MKTEVTLKSKDRQLLGIEIRQDTEGMFSITDLQRAYDIARWKYGWADRDLSNILNTQQTKERLYYILFQRDSIKTSFSGFMEMVEREGIVKTLKGLGVYKTKGRGKEKHVVADPYVWVLLAMEMNPMLYATVVVWLSDSLIFNRIDAGNEFMPMNSAIKRLLVEPDYSKFSIAINERIFGIHRTGMRNLASSKELRLIADIEKFIVNAINNGWLKTEFDILQAIKTYGC